MPAFRERSEPRLTAGSRSYEVRTLRFSGSGSITGTVRAGRPRLLGRGFRGAAARRGGPSPAGHLLVPREGARGAARRGRGAADRRPGAGARLTPAHRHPGPRPRRRRNAAGLAGKRVRVAVDALTAIRRSPSVIGETGAAGAGRVVMAGGHLDSVPQGPGLNDNGSGVAATLEIAEELGWRRLPAGTALRFAFWGPRDRPGRLAPLRRALSRTERGRIAAYVNLDMVGSPGAEPAVYDGDAAIEAALAATSGATRRARPRQLLRSRPVRRRGDSRGRHLHRPRRLLPPALRHDRQRRPRGPDHVCAGSRRRARGPDAPTVTSPFLPPRAT